jgi:hypothetical protein
MNVQRRSRARSREELPPSSSSIGAGYEQKDGAGKRNEPTPSALSTRYGSLPRNRVDSYIFRTDRRGDKEGERERGVGDKEPDPAGDDDDDVTITSTGFTVAYGSETAGP